MPVDNKKKILIVFTGAMELGGIEQSLLGLLSALDYDRYEVDLFLYGHHGSWFHLIDTRVNLLPEVKELAYLRDSFAAKLRHGCFYAAWRRLRDARKFKGATFNCDDSWLYVMRKCAPRLSKHYDLALGFFLPFDYITEKVDASYRIGWVHTDYRFAPENKEALVQAYNKVDMIAACSDQCKESFLNLFPQFSDKTMVVENILSKHFVTTLSDAFCVDTEMPRDGSIRLLTIGRFSYPKRLDEVPMMCKGLRELGLNVKWYIIGFGMEEPLIRDKIAEAGMEDHVIMLGKKENPYPYIKACDLYVQPSRYEGKSVAVREAQILGKPVVITHYATAQGQLDDGVDGVIVPMELEGCVEGISALLRDEDRMRRLSDACRQRDYTNAKEVDKLYQLL